MIVERIFPQSTAQTTEVTTVLRSEESLLTLRSNKYKEYEFSTHCFNILGENQFEFNHLSPIIQVSKKIVD